VLDGEARTRGTTVYLVDRRLDMLPGALSEDAASLLAGVDRLAVSVLWRLSADLAVKSVWFGRTVIRCSVLHARVGDMHCVRVCCLHRLRSFCPHLVARHLARMCKPSPWCQVCLLT
jgi:hypothetical protein